MTSPCTAKPTLTCQIFCFITSTTQCMVSVVHCQWWARSGHHCRCTQINGERFLGWAGAYSHSYILLSAFLLFAYRCAYMQALRDPCMRDPVFRFTSCAGRWRSSCFAVKYAYHSASATPWSPVLGAFVGAKGQPNGNSAHISLTPVTHALDEVHHHDIFQEPAGSDSVTFSGSYPPHPLRKHCLV